MANQAQIVQKPKIIDFWADDNQKPEIQNPIELSFPASSPQKPVPDSVRAIRKKKQLPPMNPAPN